MLFIRIICNHNTNNRIQTNQTTYLLWKGSKYWYKVSLNKLYEYLQQKFYGTRTVRLWIVNNIVINKFKVTVYVMQ